MALSRTMLAADLTAIIADLTESLVVGANTIACNRVSPQADLLADRLRDNFSQYTCTVAVAANALATKPVFGTTVTYDTLTLRILDIEESPDGAEWRFHLGRPYGGNR